MAATGKNFGYLKSVTIGINLDDNLRPKEAGIISVNEKEFSAGSIIDKLMKHRLTDMSSLQETIHSILSNAVLWVRLGVWVLIITVITSLPGVRSETHIHA